MHYLLSFILKQLPNLLPVIESLLKRTTSTSVMQADSRLVAVEQSLELLAERSDYLEAKLKRVMILVIVSFLFSLAALIVAVVR
jgi:hypothetical protein